ncbi:MAG: hypothetical protein ACSHYB_13700 [Roseibacillus sp.]
MQRNLRKQHRLIWLILAPLALAALAYALVNRVEMPVMEEVPQALEKGKDS